MKFLPVVCLSPVPGTSVRSTVPISCSHCYRDVRIHRLNCYRHQIDRYGTYRTRYEETVGTKIPRSTKYTDISTRDDCQITWELGTSEYLENQKRYQPLTAQHYSFSSAI